MVGVLGVGGAVVVVVRVGRIRRSVAVLIRIHLVGGAVVVVVGILGVGGSVAIGVVVVGIHEVGDAVVVVVGIRDVGDPVVVVVGILEVGGAVAIDVALGFGGRSAVSHRLTAVVVDGDALIGPVEAAMEAGDGRDDVAPVAAVALVRGPDRADVVEEVIPLPAGPVDGGPVDGDHAVGVGHRVGPVTDRHVVLAALDGHGRHRERGRGHRDDAEDRERGTMD